MTETARRIRVDKWLWHARFFKTRGLAATCAGSGRLRINGGRCEKAAQSVGPGDVLTFPQARAVRVIRIEAIGTRRGPAPEAQALYTDLEPPPERAADEPAQAPDQSAEIDRPKGSGRPTKRERRETDRLKRAEP